MVRHQFDRLGVLAVVEGALGPKGDPKLSHLDQQLRRARRDLLAVLQVVHQLGEEALVGAHRLVGGGDVGGVGGDVVLVDGIQRHQLLIRHKLVQVPQLNGHDGGLPQALNALWDEVGEDGAEALHGAVLLGCVVAAHHQHCHADQQRVADVADLLRVQIPQLVVAHDRAALLHQLHHLDHVLGVGEHGRGAHGVVGELDRVLQRGVEDGAEGAPVLRHRRRRRLPRLLEPPGLHLGARHVHQHVGDVRVLRVQLQPLRQRVGDALVEQQVRPRCDGTVIKRFARQVLVQPVGHLRLLRVRILLRRMSQRHKLLLRLGHVPACLVHLVQVLLVDAVDGLVDGVVRPVLAVVRAARLLAAAVEDGHGVPALRHQPLQHVARQVRLARHLGGLEAHLVEVVLLQHQHQLVPEAGVPGVATASAALP
mmetsp:Transcript_27996/g.61273  ORF Transcript_27996/g.61273 Transcript_27996/m.61273 type:complete len:424 (+) Transcript_27996:1291-2562(+)